MSIRLLADENIPVAAIRTLNTLGYDVAAVSEISCGATDLKVMELAVEQDRVLLTFDRDFGELIFNKALRPPKSVIYLKFIPQDPSQIVEVINLLVNSPTSKINGYFSTVTLEAIRRRPLPK